ncbi:transposase, partial [Thiolapillus sp.]
MDWLSFEQSYRPGGRSPYAPRAMMGLILYGIMQGVSSLRQLERLARTDLGCMWISGGILPDHSVIGRFIQRHEVRLSGEFFEKLTARVLQVTGTGAGTVAGDGSIIEAAASRFQEIKAEALAELIVKQREKMAASEQEAGEEKRWETEKARHDLNRLLEAQQVLEERQQQRQARGKKGEVTINRQEPEAVIQPQKDKKRFLASYKPSVLVNELRIIIGQAVDPSSETQVVTSLLDQAQQQGVIETALFDAGYFNQQVIDATEERGIELLCPEGRSQGKDWHKQSGKYYPKSHFQYD